MKTSRRTFLKTAAMTGTALAAGALKADAASTLLTESHAELGGVIDMHVHTLPDTVPRSIDGPTLAREARAAGMRGILFKCHEFPTVDDAYMIRRAVPDFAAFGGIALNANFGPRVNPVAAKAAIAMSGNLCRCVWMPTQSAMSNKGGSRGGAGIPVCDEYGKVLPEVVQVMEICRDANIIFATGHSSVQESMALIRKAREVGVQKCVYTHCTAYITLDQAKECLDNGAYLEHCIINYFKGPGSILEKYRTWPQVTMEKFASYITLAPERQFVSTDLGQKGNCMPLDGVRIGMQGLEKAGLSSAQLDEVFKHVPARLLGLEEHATGV